MRGKKAIIGSRASALALIQSESAAAALREFFPEISFEIVKVTTKGDRILDKSLLKIEGKGLFTKELEDKLLSGEIDAAVHSLKDAQTVLPQGLVIAAYLKRESPFDVLALKKPIPSLKDLPDNAIIATGSSRRKAQSLKINARFRVVDLRGNIETRLKKFKNSEADAAIFAKAALNRLGIKLDYFYEFSEEEFIPAAGQGALAVEIREDDSDAWEIFSKLNDETTESEVLAERAFLKALGGGCKTPIAAFARNRGGKISLIGGVFAPDGSRWVIKRTEGDNRAPKEVGESLADAVLSAGADKILKSF